jgi:hypothetical protein
LSSIGNNVAVADFAPPNPASFEGPGCNRYL